MRVTLVVLLLAVSSVGFAAAPGTAVRSVQIEPTRVTGGEPARGVVTLVRRAASSFRCRLSSDRAAVRVPASVLILKGRLSASFRVVTVPVVKDISSSVGARCGADRASRFARLAVRAPHLASIQFPSTVQGGSTVTGTVTLNGPAGPGGVPVTMQGTVYIASLPGTVLVPAGARSATFQVSIEEVASTRSGQFTAEAGGWKLAASFTILA